MRTNPNRTVTPTPIVVSSLCEPEQATRLSLWGKQTTRISLCILSVLCVSVVTITLGKSTTVTTSTLRNHRDRSPVVVGQASTTIILVRHAEKQIVPPENKDPDISVAGLARAQELARMFGASGVGAIYATQFKRTQQTVKPLADKLGIQVNQFEAKKTSDLVKHIREHNAGQVIFIAGHNNTVPEIIAALGGPQLPIIPEAEFDNLYILTVQSDGSAKLLKLKYGSSLLVNGPGMTRP